MKKIAFLISLVSFVFLAGTNAQPADFGMGLEGPECDTAYLDFYNYSDTVGLADPYWEWDINGMIFYEWEPPTYTFYPGIHTVTLTLYDGPTFIDSRSEDVEVIAVDSFMMSSGGEACPGEDISVWFDQSIPWYSVTWYFGDNSVMEPQHRANYPTHRYAEAGTYDVTMVLDHYCGIDTIVQQVSIGAGASPEVNGYASNGPDFCPSDPVIFNVDGEYNSYHWKFGDGAESFDRDPTHVYPNEGPAVYYATVTVTNSCGGTATDTVEVSFGNDFDAYAGFDWYFESQGMFPCPGTPVEFNAWGSGNYEWDFGDGSFSNEQKPTNYFTEPGKYYITLTVWNGCGKTETSVDSLEVQFDAEDIPYADFWVETTSGNGDNEWDDTIYVCPGMLVEFRNASYSYSGAEMYYDWDFGDGSNAGTKDASHVYNTASATPYPVTLTTSNTCGGSHSLTKYVLVDAGLKPDINPGVTPLVICSGEEVFFYLNDGIDEEDAYVFNIDFGDGQTLTNATTYYDSLLQTIANHTYTGAAGTEYDFVFSTTNTCENSTDFTGTIRITDDASLQPFYYVDNTTSSGGGGQLADWSKRRSPSDHEMVIHVAWPAWPGTQDNFGIFFWYGGFFPEGDMGDADGYVEFQTSNIQVGDSVKAYIPIDPGREPVIGFAVGWSCDGVYKQGLEPEVYGMQLDFLGLPLNSFPIMPMGYTNMNQLGNPVILDPGQTWDGLCNSERPARDYFYQLNAGQYIQLTIDKDDYSYYLDATADEDGYEYITGISMGTYAIVGEDSIEFTGTGPCSGISGLYTYILTDEHMDLTLISDACQDRAKYLTDSTFRKKADFGGHMMELAACPGDKVQFSVAGGVSWEWHFGDGSTSTERYPVHTYSAAGDYDAYVVASNACGRTDTIPTQVTIRDDALPYAGFYWDAHDVQRFESIQFETDNWIDRAGNYSYAWNFGDGTTSVLANPVHAYQQNGDYTIQLTVSNGCGSSTYTSMIWIRDAELLCEAKIKIDSVVDKTVYLQDISRGEVTNWFWDFGDGSTSSGKKPVHTYQENGVFFICLSVYDSINDCQHQVCRQVQIGTQLCIADFTSKVNSTTGKVQFTDRSSNATEWFWDFGDGSFSDLQNPEHTYNEPGWYEVCLSIYNETSDCFAYKCVELQVGEEDPNICYADFSFFVDETSNTVIFTDESSGNITNWYWTFGDGTYIEDRSPVKTYRGPGIYEVCLIVFDATTGCSDEICMEIPVGVSDCNLRADFAFFIDISSDAVTFSNRSVGTVTNYFWDFGDGGTSSAKSPKHVYEKPGFYLVSLSIWDESTGCNDHIAEFIQIGEPDCRAAFEYKVDAATQTVQFYNKSKGTLAEYFWDFDDGTFSAEKSPQHKFETAGLYFVSLTVINDNGLCMDFIFEPIQVGTVECAAKFTYFIDSSTNVAYFTPEAIGDATDYLWFFGDGSISTNKQARHRFTQPGYFTVGLNTYDDATGCMDYWEEVILIGSAGQDCRAGFSYISDPANKKVKFGDRSKGTISEYIWNFGDGQVSFEQNPVHPYAVGGYYLVCLTVVNNFGIPNTFCDFVQMATSDAEDCFAEFHYTVDSTSKTVEFVQRSHGDPDSYMWFFGDGETSTDENPKYTYTDAGYYLVELSITNSTTNCSSNNFELINVAEGNQGLRAAFDYDIDSSDLKADTYPVDFVGVSLGDAGKLKWDFGDGTIDTTTLNPTHVYTVPGVYNVCLTVTNPNTGDSSTTCQVVTTPGYVSGIEGVGAWKHQIRNYPNPFDETTYIVYELIQATDVDLVIFDQTGRMIDILVHKKQDAGEYRIEYDGSKLDAGMYTLRMATGDGVYTARMVVR